MIEDKPGNLFPGFLFLYVDIYIEVRYTTVTRCIEVRYIEVKCIAVKNRKRELYGRSH